MPDPIPVPVAPAAVSPAPAPEPVASPAPEVKTSKLLSNILGLISPEDVAPEPKKEEPVAPTPEPKKEEPAPTPAPEPKKEEPKSPEPKKVPVRKKEPAKFTTPEDITKAVETALDRRKPEPVAPAPVAPVPAPVDDDLTPEEKEELELAAYAEKKDPSKKGITEKFRKFYGDQKKFLEDRIAEEGADYDPTSDPRYKAFLAKNEPKLTATERKNLFREKTIEEAEERALKKAKESLQPEIDRVDRSVREMRERPLIGQEVNAFLEETATGMPEDVYKFYVDSGKDLEKTREAFPVETEHVMKTLQGAAALAHEFLEIRRGVKPFDAKDEMHTFLDSFVTRQGDLFLQHGGEYLVRDGKTFVHPREWKTGMEAKHWTFGDKEVLTALKVNAQREAKALVANARKQVEVAIAAQQKRTSAPSSAPVTPAPAPEPVQKSPVTPPAPSPGAATPSAPKPRSAASALLNLG